MNLSPAARYLSPFAAAVFHAVPDPVTTAPEIFDTPPIVVVSVLYDHVPPDSRVIRSVPVRYMVYRDPEVVWKMSIP
jgi:hypothetical protein